MARQSPRKKNSERIDTNSLPSVINKASGRRCRICEGRPLKADCACTLNPDGTRRIKRRTRKPKETTQNSNVGGLPLPGPAPPQTWSSPGRLTITIPAQQSPGIGSRHNHLSPHRHPEIPPNVHPDPCAVHTNQSIDPLLNTDNAARPNVVTQRAGSNLTPTPPTPPPSSPPPPSLPPSSPPLAPSSPVTNEVGIPPLRSLLATMNASFARDPMPTSDDEFNEPASSLDSMPSTPYTPGTPSVPTAATSYPFSSPEYRAARKNWEETSPARKRAPRTAKQALYGLVSGSMQGSLPLKIKRQKPLRRVMVDGAEASRRFALEMKFVIDRAERVALETGSWVFIAGQQPQARTNFIHFSSNAMRTHALEETQQLTNQFSTLISDLREARLGSALTAQRTLRATQTAFEEFQAQVKQTLEEKDRHTEYLVGMVDALRQQMGIPAGASPSSSSSM